MKNENLQSIIYASEAALSLILDEYESLQDDELRKQYDSVITKLQNAIKLLQNHG